MAVLVLHSNRAYYRGDGVCHKGHATLNAPTWAEIFECVCCRMFVAFGSRFDPTEGDATTIYRAT